MKEEDIRPRSLLDRYLEISVEDIPRFFEPARFVRVDCPGCRAPKTEAAFEKHGFAYEECAACGSLFANPRPPAEDLDRYYRESASSKFWASDFYPSTAEARRDKIFRPRAERIRDYCRETGLDPRVVVDVGSGYGIMAEELGTLMPAVEVRGIEPGASLANASRERGIAVLECTVEEASAWEGTADIVVSFEVFEHVFSPESFVVALVRLLRPGGTLLVSGLGIDGFDTQVLWERSRSIQPPHHLNFLSVHGFESLFGRVGLTDARVVTPGKLDVDIVKNAVAAEPEIPLDRFHRLLLERRGPEVHQKFQEFLAEARLSSHVWVWARRPDP